MEKHSSSQENIFYIENAGFPAIFQNHIMLDSFCVSLLLGFGLVRL